jgi:hypothetical protein
MVEPVRFSLIKPTVNTPFHIDFDWWKEHDHNWRVYLYSFLCPEHQALFENRQDEIWIDWVNPDTAEVIHVDALQNTLMTHCAKQPEFLDANTTLVNSVFRYLLANGNKPSSPMEISRSTNKSPEMILRTFSGHTIYQGIRPVSTT